MFIHLHDMYSYVRQAISIFLESNLHFLFKKKWKIKIPAVRNINFLPGLQELQLYRAVNLFTTRLQL